MEQLTLLPDELPHLWQAILIVVTSFVGSATTAAFGIGGGLLLIAVMSALVPTGAVIPVHGAIMVGSNLSRASVLLKYIDWKILGYFFMGAVVGGLLGAQIVTGLPAWAFRLAIAGFILFTQWGPKVRALGLGPRAYALAGAISTVLTLFVGASGPFMTTVISKVPGISRQVLTATAGACMTVQHSLKVLVFALAGFFYSPWLPLILLALVSGFLGTLLGAQLLGRLSEGAFRFALKWLLTGIALYLVVLAITGFAW